MGHSYLPKTKPHTLMMDAECQCSAMQDDRAEVPIATVHPAKWESVNKVLLAPEGTDNGRSEWVWVRLANGDLLLGVFPRGDTYIEVSETDGQYPGDDDA